MPPKPFPFQLGIGTDIVYRTRIKELLLKPEPHARGANLKRYLTRFMSYREQQMFWARMKDRPDLFGINLNNMTRYLAGRWAAKEATIKAVHWRELSFKHVQILHRETMQGKTGGVYALILNKPASAFKHHPGQRNSTSLTQSQQSDTLEDAGASAMYATSQQTDDDEEAAIPGQQTERHPQSDKFIPAEMQNDDLAGQVARVSISHDGDYATAVCLAAEEPSMGDVGGEAAAREP